MEKTPGVRTSLPSRMRLIHITDPHLTALEGVPLARLLGKRLLGYLSWRRRRRHLHRPERLAETVAAVRAESPDLILIGGDLCHLGLPEEIAEAGDWLRALAPPESVLLVPGNHDDYRGDSRPALLRHWREYLHLPDQATAARLGDHYPVERRWPGLTVLGLNSALPTAPGMASGRLGVGQRRRLEERLAAARARGDFVCVLSHHPPLPGQTSRRKGLTDAAALAELLHRHRVDLVLHGHLHSDRDVRVRGLPVLATASASSRDGGAPAAYRRVDVVADRDGWRVRALLRRYREGEGFATVEEEDWRVPRERGQ